MKTIKEFQKEEYELLMDTLGLKDSTPEDTNDTVYFNAWNFGLREEDCEFTISASTK